jgi:serpin B
MTDADALTDQARVASKAQTAFGLRLLSLLVKADAHHNVFISPSSVFLALGMLEAGAAGATRSTLRSTLDVPAGVSETALHESAAALSRSLRRQSGPELAIANALWADLHVTLAPDFIAHCRKFYEAQAATLDFHDPGAAGTINGWVAKNTHNKITEIVSERAVAVSKAILTNAVYFKGKWQYPFDPKQTQNGAFHHADGTVKQVPFMRQAGLRGVYRSGEGYEAAVLPYASAGSDASVPSRLPPAYARGSETSAQSRDREEATVNSSRGHDAGGGRLMLCVVLPQAGVDVAAVLAKADVRQLLESYEPAELELRLPRFSLDYGSSLKTALTQMGMAVAFEYGADFSPLGSGEFFVGDVIHKTRLELDEEGTVAAAVTAILAPMGMPRPLPQKSMVVDRPFGLLLCDRQTEAVIFAGVVYEP